jgi:hypothetical protein
MKIGEYEQMMSWLTRPESSQIEPRENFKGGTNPTTGMGFQKGNTMGIDRDLKGKPSLNVEGKNQHTATQKTAKEIQAIIDANPEYITPKNFYEPTDIMKQKGMKKLLTFTETQNPDVVFQRRGPPDPDPTKQTATNTKRTAAKKRLEGRIIQLKSPKGYQVHHIMPLAGGEDLRTGDYAVVSKEMNAKMSKYDIKINKLVNEAYDLDYSKTKNLKRLKDINNNLFDILKTVKKNLPKKYEGLLGFNKLTPVLDTFDDQGKQVFNAEPQGIDYKKSIAGSRGDKVKDTKKSTMQNMADNAPKFKAALLPGLEQIVEGMKNIPDDIAKKRYFTLGLKALGPLGAYLGVKDTYEALKEGKSVAEALEYGLIGTNVIGSTKDVFNLSPEEREARSVVKQAEMTDQIAQDESLLDSDFETPKVKSDLTRSEAEKQYALGQAKVKAENEANEANIARARATDVKGLKDLMMGERFKPQEISKQFMANGGIMRLIKKFTNDK